MTFWHAVWIGVSLALIVGGCGTTGKTMDREKVEFHYKLANTSYYEHNMVGALKELTTVLEEDPEHPDAHHLMGFILFGRKEHASAERHFRKALTIRPGFLEARANLGALLLATRRWPEAISTLQPLVNANLYSTPWIVYNNMGYAYQKLRKHQKAQEQFRLALFHNPKFCLGYNNMGSLYKEMGQEDMAMEYLRSATEKCKKYAEPHFHLGEILDGLGRQAEARTEFGQCYQDAPESAFGRRCRRRM